MSLITQIKKQVESDRPYLIAFYGPSTVSFEYIFPNWTEVIRYAVKDHLETVVEDYKKIYWNIFTMNLGMSGATSKDLLERADYVRKMDPDLVFVTSSKNDAYLDISPDQSGKNSSALITYFLEQGKKVVFLTSIPSLRNDLNEKIAPYVDMDRGVSKKFGKHENFLFIDLYQLFPSDKIERSYTMISESNPAEGVVEHEKDPIHYNHYGNSIVAKIILKEAFGIEFDNDKFLQQAYDEGIKYPAY